MIKKLILSLIILFIWYVLLIFTLPSIASWIENLLGINWFNNKIIELKEFFNDKSTSIPKTDEILSWAIDFKNNVINSVDTTKEKIDSIRKTMSWVENTYNDIKNWYDDVVNFIDTNSWKIDSIKTTIQQISDIKENLTNTWEIN